MSIFDINDAESFLHSIKQRYIRYMDAKVRPTEDLLYIIMGLNHLREWIAPDYDWDRRAQKLPDPANKSQAFSKEIYESPEHKMVRELCNRTKHPKSGLHTATRHESFIDDWPDFDSVSNFDLGPPTGHFVEDVPVERYIEPLIKRYEHWFNVSS